MLVFTFFSGLREADIRVELTESLIAAFQSDLDVDGGAGDAIVPDWFYRDYKEVYAKNIRRVHADLVEMWAKCTYTTPIAILTLTLTSTYDVIHSR